MSRIAIAAAVSVLAVAGAAQAQSIGATGATSATLTYDNTVNGTTHYGDGVPEAIHSVMGPNREVKGGSFEAIVDITESHVSFESGVAVSGPYSAAESFSGVDVTVANLSQGSLSIANFGSTIIPAGMGFYLQDRTGGATDNNVFTGYGQTASGLTFQDLVSTVGTGVENPFAYASFDFTVGRDDQAPLYALSGWMSLYFDEQGQVQAGYGLNNASEALTGFTGVHGTPTDPFGLTNGFTSNAFAYGFAWDATDIVIPLNALLEYEQSETLLYRTSVTATTNAACITATTCLVAYSGFGDPIGRGGGISSFAKGPQPFGATGPITGIVFDPVEFDPFQMLTSGAVPEPATWLSMILGFGLLGSALRRRRLAPAAI